MIHGRPNAGGHEDRLHQWPTQGRRPCEEAAHRATPSGETELLVVRKSAAAQMGQRESDLWLFSQIESGGMTGPNDE
jgi:hypothetical protein